MKPATVHLTISGRVQGVFYRASLSEVAQRHGVLGWVRNCRDGSVQALLHGDHDAVEAVLAWARRGPPAARVQNIEQRPASEAERALVRQRFLQLPDAGE